MRLWLYDSGLRYTWFNWLCNMNIALRILGVLLILCGWFCRASMSCPGAYAKARSMGAYGALAVIAGYRCAGAGQPPQDDLRVGENKIGIAGARMISTFSQGN
jgi:hypothetical protein